MSRSYRKTPICGNTKAESEKEDKKIANRSFRRKTKMQLINSDEELLFNIRQVCDGRGYYSKDGKQWIDKEEHPDIMRK